jgi:hypothetical protein
MSLGAAVIRGDRSLIESSLNRARAIAAEARSLLVRGQDPLERRNHDRHKARQRSKAMAERISRSLIGDPELRQLLVHNASTR